MLQIHRGARSVVKLAALLGALSAGCAASVATTSGSGGGGGEGAQGGSGGEAGGGAAQGGGGSGGAACVPETEECDGVDNNCDGFVDEGCDCETGEEQSCYSGMPASSAGVGQCKGGIQTCDALGQWGPCVGQVVPAPEACDGVDNDCNGQLDDLAPIVCGIGACQVMAPSCVNGQVGACTPGLPQPEVCDGVDNDCNGVTDEADPNVGAACASAGLGLCEPGTLSCEAGALVCNSSAGPVPEVCNGLDDDCDGQVDENLAPGGQCITGLNGVCAFGENSCGANGPVCTPVNQPSPEICDFLDNDCNGLTDEFNPEGGQPCNTGLPGACGQGITNCVLGVLECDATNNGSPETCNGVDDDCDGTVDDGDPGGGVACGCGGTTTCNNGAIECVQGVVTTYFSESFANNSQGWTLGSEWQIGPAVAGPAGNCADPGTDATPTADNGVAGVVIGGCSTSSVSKTLHGHYYLTSPVINTAAVPGPLYLSFKRWLLSDYTPYMQNVIEVYNGSSWVAVWTSSSTGIYDASWQTINHDLTAYKNANMQIRFGFSIGSSGVFSVGSWSIDDVTLSNALCQ
jgi:hypothetical protein